MAINKLNSNFKDKLGNNPASRAGNIAAGIIGVGALAYGAFKIGDSVSLDGARYTFAFIGGGMLAAGTIEKIKYGENVTYKQARRVNYLAGSILVGLAALPVIDGLVSSESDTSTSTTESTAMQTNPSMTGTSIVSKPPGMCEINIPYKSDDTQSVKKMQAALTEIGFDTQYIDGINGQLTINALKDFKIANGYDTSEYFNEEMCAKIPSLVDGDANTPNLGGGN